MPRLFYKIFLWFWLGVIAISGTLFALTELTHSRAEEDRQWREKYSPRVDLWTRQEVEILNTEGTESLRKYVNSFQLDPGVSNYIFDADGREVLGRGTSTPVRDALAATMASPVPRQQPFDAERIIAQKVIGPRGRPYVIIVDFPEPSLLGNTVVDLLFAEMNIAVALRLTAMLLVAGGVCFWLARQIVDPIGRLRTATREIANERLHVRADTALLARGDELADLGRDFDRMAERIEGLVNTHRDLLSDVSHALRSPLARLNVALGLARRNENPGNKAHLDRIEYETERLNVLIGQLLTMARLDSGVDLERMSPFDLGLLVDEVTADANYEAAGRSCKVEVFQHSECTVVGAREMLRGAVENVVRNAVRHTADHTTIDVIVRCSTTCHGQLSVVQVRDRGLGVPDAALADLFTPFCQIVDSRRSDNGGGVGLGLAITRRAFEIHRGAVSAMNAPDGGLIVMLELPSVEAHAAQAPVVPLVPLSRAV
jgi:signal transduction histidine kinase